MCLDALESLLLFVVALQGNLSRKGKSKAKQNKHKSKTGSHPGEGVGVTLATAQRHFRHAGEPLSLHVLYSLSQPSDWIFLPSQGLDHISLMGKWHQVELYLTAKD